MMHEPNRASVQGVSVQGVSVQVVYVLGGKCLGGTYPLGGGGVVLSP